MGSCVKSRTINKTDVTFMLGIEFANVALPDILFAVIDNARSHVNFKYYHYSELLARALLKIPGRQFSVTAVLSSILVGAGRVRISMCQSCLENLQIDKVKWRDKGQTGSWLFQKLPV